jgi:hypothetical protein
MNRIGRKRPLTLCQKATSLADQQQLEYLNAFQKPMIRDSKSGNARTSGILLWKKGIVHRHKQRSKKLQTVTYQAAFMEAHVAVPIQVAQKGNLGVMQHLSLVIEHRVEGVVVLFDLTCCRELLHAAVVYVRRYDVPVR